MNKAERLNQELIYLNGKNIFHLQDLTEAFNISRRTALRDIPELESMGLSIYVEPGRFGGYHILHHNLNIPVTFNLEEVNAIFFAIKALSALSSTPFEKSYQHIYDKLMATLPASQQKKVQQLQDVVKYYRIPAINQPIHLSNILQAILNQSNLTIKSSHFTPKKQVVQPYELLYRDGLWLFDAYDIDRKEWGTYRSDYLEECHVSNPQTAKFSHEQLKGFQQEYEKTYHNIPFQCHLTPVGVELFQKNHYPNMKLKTEGQQNLLYGGYNHEEYDYMIDYLISLGDNVTIDYPEELIQGYLKRLEKIMIKYKKTSSA